MKLAVLMCAQKMIADRLVTGTSGNVSCIDRDQGLLAITPSGVDYDAMQVSDISVVDLKGVHHSGGIPSTETPLHLAIYRKRGDVATIVHTHSMYATSFAVLGEPILAIHYMVAALGGNHIPVTPKYALFGTDDLAQQVIATLSTQYRGTLVRNHGVVTIGETVQEAYKLAVIVEEMAELYFHASSLGTPHILSAGAMDKVRCSLKKYGQVSRTGGKTASSDIN